MSVQRGITTPQQIPFSGRRFAVADSPPPCFRDRWGDWQCGHDHDDVDLIALEDAYHYTEGWTAQGEGRTPIEIH
jgi:hypothetical protein